MSSQPQTLPPQDPDILDVELQLQQTESESDTDTDTNQTSATQPHGFLNTHHRHLTSYLRPSSSESNVTYIWKCILNGLHLEIENEGEGKPKEKKPRRHFDVRTTKLLTPYSEKHDAVLGCVARSVVRRRAVVDGGSVEKVRQEKTVLVIEPRAGPGTIEVLGSTEGLERWWDEMLVPRFRETVGGNWGPVFRGEKEERRGVSAVLAAGVGVRVFWARRDTGGEVVLERAHEKSVLDLREGRDQDVVEGLLKAMLERAWEDDDRAPWEGVEVEVGKGLMYRPV